MGAADSVRRDRSGRGARRSHQLLRRLLPLNRPAALALVLLAALVAGTQLGGLLLPELFTQVIDLSQLFPR